MKYPNFNEEKKLWKRGFKYVVGLDEAGRGPLCGPVVAGAVIFPPRFKILGKLKEVKDSKQLSAEKREELFKILINHPQIKWGIGRVSEKIIDKINILEATKLAMRLAIKDLDSKADFLLIDGNFTLQQARGGKNIPQKAIVKGDTKVFSIATASIIAKVTRDKIMVKYDKKYPEYGFKKHKGYPTEFHRQRIKEFGFCKIHRKSFSWI